MLLKFRRCLAQCRRHSARRPIIRHEPAVAGRRRPGVSSSLCDVGRFGARAASGTAPVNFEMLNGEGESIGRGDVLSQSFNDRIVKFDDMSADSADQMIMGSLIGNVIVVCFFTEISVLRKADFA